jgi:hypothetical protein
LAVTIFGAVVLPVRKYQLAKTARNAIASIHALFLENLMLDAQLSSRHPQLSSNYHLLDVSPQRRFRPEKRRQEAGEKRFLRDRFPFPPLRAK